MVAAKPWARTGQLPKTIKPTNVMTNAANLGSAKGLLPVLFTMAPPLYDATAYAGTMAGAGAPLRVTAQVHNVYEIVLWLRLLRSNRISIRTRASARIGVAASCSR